MRVMFLSFTLLKRLSFLLLLVIFKLAAFGQNPVLEEHWWHTDISVSTIAIDEQNDIVYIGGGFSYIGPPEPFGTQVDLSTGLADLHFDNPNNSVYTSAPDGQGGWFIGGEFTKVGEQTRNFLAHINNDGSLNIWNPNPNGIISNLSVSGNKLFVAGNFTEIDGVNRNFLASFDINTGLLNSWDPNPNGWISTITASNGILYLGGQFTYIGGQSRERIAAIDTLSGNATSWNPGCNGHISSIDIAGDTVFIGGYFTTVNGQSRNYLASIDAITGFVTSWQPYLNSPILSLVVHNNIVYVGGVSCRIFWCN